jgi:hypothetical protein
MMISLRTLPADLRVLFSGFLILIGIGYLTAIFYLVLVDVDPHRTMGMGLIAGIEMKYRGGGITRLEAALRGTMADNLEPDERRQILSWIRNGTTETGYGKIKPIFENNCVACHSAQSGQPIPPLTTYEEVRKLTRVSAAPSFAQLARVSHVHLFGISMVFLLTGAIFALSATPSWLRVSLIALPYLAIFADIAAWWVTRYEPLFAYVVVIGGAAMGISLAGQILISLWDMWIGVTQERRKP